MLRGDVTSPGLALQDAVRRTPPMFLPLKDAVRGLRTLNLSNSQRMFRRGVSARLTRTALL